MKPDEFKQRLRALGLTQEEFGRLMDTPLRTVQYWATVSVPSYVGVLARLLDRRPELVEVLRDMSSEDRKS